jgi:hypothetical protein
MLSFGMIIMCLYIYTNCDTYMPVHHLASLIHHYTVLTKHYILLHFYTLQISQALPRPAEDGEKAISSDGSMKAVPSEGVQSKPASRGRDLEPREGHEDAKIISVTTYPVGSKPSSPQDDASDPTASDPSADAALDYYGQPVPPTVFESTFEPEEPTYEYEDVSYYYY